MFNTTNYYEQARVLGGLSVQDAIIVKDADRYTFYREICKIATIIAVVSAVACVIFQMDPTTPFSYAACFAISWCYFRTSALFLEAQAKKAIEFKAAKNLMNQFSSLDFVEIA